MENCSFAPQPSSSDVNVPPKRKVKLFPYVSLMPVTSEGVVGLQQKVLPSVEPGFLRPQLPAAAPNSPDSWQQVLQDVDTVIMPGFTHTRSPHFHAFFPSATSFPAIVGDLMVSAIGGFSVTWKSGPAQTELELVMMDWLAKAMDIPRRFHNEADSPGGGVLQSSASESILYSMVLSKEEAVRRVQKTNPEMSEHEIKSKLVCYISEQSNMIVERSGLVASLRVRSLPPDAAGRMRGEPLREAVRRDIRQGLIPCYVCATYGTTDTCAFNSVEEIGPVCREFGLWLHVDAAYAGAALVCPELRPLMPGLDMADSIVVNLHKLLLVNFDCAAMWFKSRKVLLDNFKVDKTYLQSNVCQEWDLMKYRLPLQSKFRSLKVWFTLRLYGVEGLRAHVREHIACAEHFERLVRDSPFFEVVTPSCLGLVCFRCKGDESLTQRLMEELTRRRGLFLQAGRTNGQLFLRYVVCNAPPPGQRERVIEDEWRQVEDAARAVIKTRCHVINGGGAPNGHIIN